MERKVETLETGGCGSQSGSQGTTAVPAEAGLGWPGLIRIDVIELRSRCQPHAAGIP